MLVSLNIRDFAIIDTLEIELRPGMTALTGETGAGKSILLDALGLLLGDRADAGAIRHGAERADISASFDISGIASARAWLAEQALDLGDECQVRRVIAREGRSRAYINGSPLPVQSLRDFGERLVDIHGQHEHQSLMKRDMQRQLIDARGGHRPLVTELAELRREWQQVGRQIETLLGSGQDRDARLDFLRFQLHELDELAPQAEEVEQLHREHAKLANAGQLLSTCETHLDRLYEGEHCAQTLISRALADLQSLSSIDTALTETGALLTNALVQLEEGVAQLRVYRDDLELDPQRLEWLEQRLDRLHQVARKHRIDAEELPAFHRRLSDDLQRLEAADQHLETLEAARRSLSDRYRQKATELHRRRVDTAAVLSDQVTTAMQALGMRGGKFQVDVSAGDAEGLPPHGIDSIEFLVSANPGQPLRPLARVASGGELSRISLAIQVVAAADTGIPTLIFDEVDAGIGGAIAEAVGRQMRALGTHHQVLCVTHLAQVACQANQQLQISKLTGKQSTRTRAREIDAEERVEEIARMLGGAEITTSTRRHAAEMLERAAQPCAATGQRRRATKGRR
jgi:DNA repair protein RecN (Recombination protein N)